MIDSISILALGLNSQDDDFLPFPNMYIVEREKFDTHESNFEFTKERKTF